MPLFTFRRENRLNKKKDISDIFSLGNSFANESFAVYFKKSVGETSKLCVIISKKNVKKSVERSRIKRLVKEFFRLNKHNFTTAAELIVITRRKHKIVKYSDAERSLTYILKNFGLLK